MMFKRICDISEIDCSLRHICLSARMEQLGSRRKDFRGILYNEFLVNLSTKFIVGHNGTQVIVRCRGVYVSDICDYCGVWR